MKAFVINRFGGAEVFESTELAVPAVAAKQVLVRVHATGINPLDYKLRRGDFPAFTHDFPAVLHGDFAGEVVEVGAGVSGFAPGDQVYGCAGGIRGRQGALAEFMLADADLLAHKPKSLSYTEAAVLPLVTITAWEALVDTALIKPGSQVLIHAGTGGVGHIAAQLAKWQGAEVFTTVSNAQKAELSRQYGADHTINYRDEAVADYVARCTDGRGFDVVLDTVGASTFEQSLAAARVGGHVISVLAMGSLDMTLAWARKLTVHCINMSWPMATGEGMAHHGALLARAAELVDAGLLQPLLDPKSFTWQEIAQAHQHAESGMLMGKVSVTVG
ncbi:zinc-dependent alcohol dehydrogenase family protein [Atopomonas hussainii]|uniref:zinc-dependent alcohol dehydrogenase family protein n=1 Tax=Atopomonas hussainii TaxID=1429083 RepID=UPI0009003780|nr:zinc-dependent alcohol dehydrogenase family protein [Atopomonas hussainii]